MKNNEVEYQGVWKNDKKEGIFKVRYKGYNKYIT